MATKTKKKATGPVTFYARSPNQTVIVVPKRAAILDAQNRVLEPAVEGHTVQFEGGCYETSDSAELAALREDPMFGNQYGWVESTPESGDTITEITAAAAARNIQRLREIEEDEQEGYQRGDVLKQARAAIEAVEGQPKAKKKPAAKKKASEGAGKAAEAESDNGVTDVDSGPIED